MPRPRKKSVLTREEFCAFRAFGFVQDDHLPDNPDLLKDINTAFLNRLNLRSPAEARQLWVYLQLLAAHESDWSQRPTPTGLRSGVEWQQYWERRTTLLEEIVRGTVTKATHFPETVLMQQDVVDAYLNQHPTYRACQNAATRAAWLKEHEANLIGLLVRYPCFHDYGDALDLSRPLKNKLDEVLTPGKFRDLILAIVHNTTPVQIAKIRKQGSRSTIVDNRLFRPLEEVTALPFSGIPLFRDPL